MPNAKQILCFGLPLFIIIKLMEGEIFIFLVLSVLYYFLVYGISKHNLDQEIDS